jgi:hypothetical protein
MSHIHLSFSMDSSKVYTGMRSLVQKSMDKITKLEEKSTCFFFLLEAILSIHVLTGNLPLL